MPQHNLFRRLTAEGIEIHPGGAGGANRSPVSSDQRSGLRIRWQIRTETPLSGGVLAASAG